MTKYASYALTSFKNTQVYKLEVLFRVIGSVLLVIVMRDLWSAIYRFGPDLESSTGVKLADMGTYAIVAVMASRLLYVEFSWEMSERVRSGDIVFDLQKPWNYQLVMLAKMAGSALFALAYVVIPLCVTAIVLFPMRFPTGWQAAAFAVSMALAFVLAFAIEFLLGLLTFLFTEVWGFMALTSTAIQLCSGVYIPLWFFPETLGKLVGLLPFQGLYNIPLSIYIGKMSGDAVWNGLLFQLGWSSVLFLAGHFGLRAVSKRLMTAGG